MPLAFTAHMARLSVEYAPRDPGGRVLYQVVRDHFETFRAAAAHLRDGEGLLRFVEEEVAAFLRCGWLAGGGDPRIQWTPYLTDLWAVSNCSGLMPPRWLCRRERL